MDVPSDPTPSDLERASRGSSADVARAADATLRAPRYPLRHPANPTCGLGETRLLESPGAHGVDERVAHAPNRVVEQVVPKAERVRARLDRSHRPLLHSDGVG